MILQIAQITELMHLNIIYFRWNRSLMIFFICNKLTKNFNVCNRKVAQLVQHRKFFISITLYINETGCVVTEQAISNWTLKSFECPRF